MDGRVIGVDLAARGVKRRFGRPLDLAAFDTPEFRRRFWSKVDRRGPDECWPWIRYCKPQGYGQFTIRKGTFENASRVAFVLTKGPLRDRQVVRHTCDNPPCCNPAHLLSGTQVDNSYDAIHRGRARRSRGEHHRDRRLTEDLVRQIRSRTFRYGERTALARELGVSLTCIRRVLSGRTWGHVA
jgi:hypothetical protein